MGLIAAIALGAASLGLGITSTVLQAGSQNQQSKTEEAIANYNAQLAEQEAEQRQLEAERQKHEKEREINKHSERTIAEQIASFASSGVELQGSPLSSMTSNIGHLKRELLGIDRAETYRQRMIREKARQERMKAGSIRSARGGQTFGTILGGAGSSLGSAASVYTLFNKSLGNK